MKKIICLVLTAVFCIGLLYIPVFGDSKNMQEELLYALGIMKECAEENTVSRAEMVKRALALLKVTPKTEEIDTGFADVPANHPYAVYIKIAKDIGMISAAQSFEPDKAVSYQEALKMLAFTLGYDRDILASAQNVIKIAATSKITANVKPAANGAVSERDVKQLLLNTLNAPLYGLAVISRDGCWAVKLMKSQTGATLLTQVFRIARYQVCFLKDVDSQNGTCVEILQVKEDKKLQTPFDKGDVVGVTLDDTLQNQDLQYMTADIWMDEQNTVYCIDMARGLRVVYGVIDEINQNDTIGALHDSRYIKSVAVTGEEDYLDVANGCQYYFNEQQIAKGGYPFVGSYARLILKEEEIISMQAWSLSEGGMITGVDAMDVVYTRGKAENLALGNLGRFEHVKLIINGDIGSVYALQTDVLFDYWKSDDEKMLLLVGSTRAITDEMNSYATDFVEIGGDAYAYSLQRHVYFADHTGGYQAKAEDLIGQIVTAYLDDGGYVRYVKYALKGQQRQNFYGLLSNYRRKGLQKPEIEIYCIQDRKVQKKTYLLDERIKFEDGLSVDSLCAELEKIYRSGFDNTMLKEANLLYRFKLNAEQEVVKIAAVNHFDLCPESGIFVNDFTASSYAYMPTPRIYFENAAICAFYSDEDGLKAKMLEWKEIQANTCTGVRCDFYSEPESSEVDLLLLRGDLKNMRYTRTEYLQYGLISQKTLAYDMDKERAKTKIKLNGVSYYPSDEAVVKDVKNYAFAVYSRGNGLLSNNSVHILALYNLSSEPELWETVSGTAIGLHRAQIEQWDDRRIYFDDGNRFYIGSDMPVYQILSNGKLVKSSLGVVHEGAEAWYVYYDSEIRGLFYR